MTSPKLLLFLLLGLSVFLPSDAQAAGKPLKVYILAGQSNMQGHAQVRTFDAIGTDPKTAPLLKEMLNKDGSPRVCEDVWISSIGSSDEEKHGKLTASYGAAQRGPKIGPEFTFGITMQKLVDQPILIIKTAWGGKSLNTDFRPPSAGPYEFNEQQLENFKKQGKDLQEIKQKKAEATGRYYRLMMDHVKKVLADIKRVDPDYNPQAGYELAGFVWFQGWNDMVDGGTYPNRSRPGGYAKYSEVMADFIRDVRKDLSAPELPFVIGVMGVGGPVEKYGPEKQRYKSTHSEFRKAMAAPASMPEFKGNVAAVLTEKYWDLELSELVDRRGKINAKRRSLNRDKTLTAEERKKQLDEFTSKLFTSKELKTLEAGTSNAAYHYLGSAKILGQIGKAFAEALDKTAK
jgi:alpha-galactosidase